VIVYIRLLDGQVRKGENLLFKVANEKFISLEVGTFSPEEFAREKLNAGDIGYIVTGIKKPGIASVGDTITLLKNPLPAFPGYLNPQPVVWASVYPESQDDFNQLRMALGRLKLSDSAFSFEEESSGALGRGYRCGFLGMLHLEIITERLKRELNTALHEAGGNPSLFESFEIDPTDQNMNAENTVFYFNPIAGEEYSEPFDSEKIIGYANIPEATRQYYRDAYARGEKPFLFHGIPHILHKGSIDIKKVKRVTS
jgi:GTP-binding protein LepA